MDAVDSARVAVAPSPRPGGQQPRPWDTTLASTAFDLVAGLPQVVLAQTSQTLQTWGADQVCKRFPPCLADSRPSADLADLIPATLRG
jgi:hypothetical protein